MDNTKIALFKGRKIRRVIYQNEWWFKNGDRDATFFAVRYDNGEEKPFYVDFIVKLKDGKIGLFDTKAGLTKQVAGPKIDGLYKYIQNENKKGKKCFGGIVANTERNYRGRWVYFDKASKQLKDNFKNWKDLVYKLYGLTPEEIGIVEKKENA